MYIPSITVALISSSAKPTDGLDTFSDILYNTIPVSGDISGSTSLSPLGKNTPYKKKQLLQTCLTG